MRQRLGLDGADLGGSDKRALLAARAASLLFTAQAMLVVGASLAGGGLDAVAAASAALVTGIAAVIVCAYERLPRRISRLLATADLGIITVLVASHPGAYFELIYVGVVVYVAFFFSRRQALAHLALGIVLAGFALILTLSPGDALHTWTLVTGTLAAAALTTIAIRSNLLQLMKRSREREAELDAFFQHAPAGFGLLDCELRHERVNQALAEMMGLERSEIEDRTLRDVAPLNADVLEPLARGVIESGEPVLGIEVENSDGRCHLVSYYPVPGRRGIVGVGTAVTDVTHLKTVERSLEDTNRKLTVLASTDELTGLPNRRMFGEQLDLALARARRGGLAVAVLCLDLDRFKEVNDSLGHAYGDKMLVKVASVLRRGARDTDVVARLGGDEFLILLADLDVQEAPKVAETVIERIRHLLANPVRVDAVEIRAKACIGLAIYPTDSRESAGLLAAADAAMYSNKHALARVV